MDKKNTMLLTVIAVATLLVAVVGATFAFFTASNTASGETKVTTTTETVGSVTVTNPTPAMHLYLAAADMTEAAAGTKGVDYWATTDPDENHVAAAEHNPVSQVSVSGTKEGASTVYECTFDMKVTKPSIVETNDAALVLTLTDATIEDVTSGAEIDLASVEEKYTVSFTQTGDVTNKTLVTAAVKYSNLTVEQDHLAGTTLNVSIVNENLQCTVK